MNLTDSITWIHILIPLVISVLAGFVTYLTTVVTLKEKTGNLEKIANTTEANVRDIRQEIKEIRDKVIQCETILRERGPLVQRSSPLSLTEGGKLLLSNSGGNNFVDENFDELYKKVDEKNPKTAYDIQELSQEILQSLHSEDRFIPLKKYAFKEGLPLSDIIQVMGIYLRDKILDRKGWLVDDIDKHDPFLKKE